MKKYLLIGTLSTIISAFNANAGDLSIEDESDIKRVYRNVINFCTHHHNQLLDLKKNNFDSTKCSESFESIKKGNADLIIEFNRTPKYFVRDLLGAINYVKNNENTVKNKIGNEEYKYFSSGLKYLDEIIYAISEK